MTINDIVDFMVQMGLYQPLMILIVSLVAATIVERFTRH